MLQQQTIDIIKSTVPVLEVHGLEITKTFYKNMLGENPALLNIFNHANQAKGRQQTALANTVYAAAMHIDNLEPIVPAVMLIAHKHRSLGVLPEHYPIVGEHLLRAIKEVLGDAATAEIINAWAEAYGVIADIFIQVEEDLYKAAEANGGWRFFKEFKVTKKEQESENVTSFYLAPVDGEKLPEYKAGQYIGIRVKIPGEEYTLNRQYTVSQPSNQNEYRISVKREDDHTPTGKVSNHLHQGVNVGDTIEVSAPAGVFTLEEGQSPILFISGGIGVTPLNTMLQAIENNREVAFIQCARNKQVIAFGDEVTRKIASLNGKHTFYYSDTDGYLTQDKIAPYLQPGSHVYICGPVPFMECTIDALKALQVPEENIHYEFFGPAMVIAAK